MWWILEFWLWLSFYHMFEHQKGPLNWIKQGPTKTISPIKDHMIAQFLNEPHHQKKKPPIHLAFHAHASTQSDSTHYVLICSHHIKMTQHQPRRNDIK